MKIRKSHTAFNRMIWIACLAGMAAGLVCFSTAFSAAASQAPEALSASVPEIVVVVDTEVDVARKTIRLGDLAEIQAEDGAVRELLASLEVAPAPRPGMQRTLYGRRVSSIVASVAIPGRNVRVVVPEIITISRSSQTVSEDALKVFLLDQLSNVLTPDDVLGRFSVRGLGDFPTGNLSLSLAEYKLDKRNRLSATIAVDVDGEAVATLKIFARIDRFRPVICSSRALSRGVILTEADIVRKRINLTRAPNHTTTSIADVVGKELTRSVRTGDCILTDMLSNPTVINRGDRVNIILETGLLKVAAMGVAKDDGGVNDRIRVENTQSNRSVTGRVVDASTVMVTF